MGEWAWLASPLCGQDRGLKRFSVVYERRALASREAGRGDAKGATRGLRAAGRGGVREGQRREQLECLRACVELYEI